MALGAFAHEGVLRTVLGDIPSRDMGITLPHEHLLCDASAWRVETTDPIGQEEPRLDNLWWFRQHPDSNPLVLGLGDESAAIDELLEFRQLGGGTLLELSCEGLAGDPVALTRISRATEVHIVAGCGFYLDSVHPEWSRSASVDELADFMVRSVEEGILDTGVCAGVVGELGMSWPLTSNEEKVLRAGARAQRRTGAAITVHTAIHSQEHRPALLAADILEEEGADLTRVVMGHLDSFLPALDYQVAVAERGCYVEFDTFGCEFFESEVPYVWPSDRERTRAVRDLVDRGFADRLLLSQDVYIRIQWQRYGGVGYGHLLRNIVPRLRLEGIREEQIEMILSENRRRVFPLARSA